VFIKLSPQYSILDPYIPVARHKVIHHALRAIGYTVKSAVHTYPPGRAAVLSRVIVPLCHVGSN